MHGSPATGPVRQNGSVAEVRPRSTTSRVQAVRPAGKFRIYLGSAAGVGKTCAMLDEGWRRHHRGTDVVVGFVETHGRPHTAELIRELEVVPRKVVEYRGTEFEEMDLGCRAGPAPRGGAGRRAGPHQRARFWAPREALGGRPRAAGGRDRRRSARSTSSTSRAWPTRWRRSPGCKIRERVPDWVVRQADQLELIDSSADQLRRRMLHGNIYPAREGARRPGRLLQDRESGGPARAGPALRGRRDGGGAPPLPAEPATRRGVGHGRAHHGGRHRGPGQ